MNEQKEEKLKLIKLNLGKELIEFIEDKDVNEIAVNDNQMVSICTFSKGWIDTEKKMEEEKTLSIIRLVADYEGIIVNEIAPTLETTFPDGSRFSASINPVSPPSFNLRKHSILIFSLDDYIKQGNISKEEKEIICESIRNKENILIIGATGSGKTTFANACIAEIEATKERLLIAEDTKEIQCKSQNTLRLLTSPTFPMVKVIEHSLRRTPERLVVGEVRGKEALYLLTGWNSGHGGGVCTIHSHTALKGLRQLEQYILRESLNPQKELIADNINLIIVLEKIGNKRKIVEIKRMKGLDENNNYILDDIKK